MVGLTDVDIQLNARIRVGQDFGRILYIGPVSFFQVVSKFFQ